jgi:hypothetical protein
MHICFGNEQDIEMSSQSHEKSGYNLDDLTHVQVKLDQVQVHNYNMLILS